ncbi:MAG: winged helix-turn-helix domain-containing protein [Acidobacteriia bacterium]|nr:winged helix-turn-helix domain-containing protein [Terriglobia bacterium]
MPAGQEDVKSLPARAPRKLRFGVFEVDLDSRELLKSGRQIRLQRKPFQVLELLLRIRGRFVSRAELTRELWPNLHVNFERSLNTAVNALRKALGDSSHNPGYIETRPGLGYRFIAPVQEMIQNQVAVVNQDAHQNCAKARYFLNKQTQEDLHKAIAYFQAALDEDSRCARAYAGLAETSWLAALMNMEPPGEAGSRARLLATTAAELDPDNASARTALGCVKRFFEWDWAGAAEEFRRAVALDASCPVVRQAYGSFLSSTGNMQDALHEYRLAQGLDPVSPAAHVEAAWTLYLARDSVGAHEQCWKMLALEPSFGAAQHVLGLAYEQMQMYDEAVIEIQNAQSSGDEQPAVIAALGHAWAKAGNTGEAQKTLHRLKQLSAKRYVSPYWHAIVCAGLGHSDLAIEWLETAYQQRDVWLTWLAVDPRFDELRDAPGFKSILHRMHFELAEALSS